MGLSSKFAAALEDAKWKFRRSISLTGRGLMPIEGLDPMLFFEQTRDQGAHFSVGLSWSIYHTSHRAYRDSDSEFSVDKEL